jgi:hypothetical protein
MPNVTGDNLTFNIDGITDNQMLISQHTQVYLITQTILLTAKVQGLMLKQDLLLVQTMPQM